MSKQKYQKVAADSACFVCGPKNPIGLQAVFTTDNDTCTSHATLEITSNFQGWQDVIHGGILASLLDEACIYACRAKADQCVTAELQVRYRKPVPVGAKVVVTGSLTDSSRKIWQAVAQLKIADTLYAEATAKVFVLDR
ncbi:MAG: PaaI family thioesterase [Desulfuromusa sp.]|nr:PaaI family thioesterase [Desulfuromusa sp.]